VGMIILYLEILIFYFPNSRLFVTFLFLTEEEMNSPNIHTNIESDPPGPISNVSLIILITFHLWPGVKP
jgi:hypothetical protein